MKRIVGLLLVSIVVCGGVVPVFAKRVSNDNGPGDSKHQVKLPAIIPSQPNLVKENEPIKQLSDANVTAGKKQTPEQIRQRLRQRIELKKREAARLRTGLGRDANEMLVRDEKLGRFREQAELRRQLPAEQDTTAGIASMGKEQQQQIKAIKEQMTQDEIKHRTRVARLEQIRELAQSDDAIETVTKVNNLLGKEVQRYEHKRLGFAEKLREVYRRKVTEDANK